MKRHRQGWKLFRANFGDNSYPRSKTRHKNNILVTSTFLNSIHPFLHALTSLLLHLGLCNYSDRLITISSTWSSSSLFSLLLYLGLCNFSDRLVTTSSSSSTSWSSTLFSLLLYLGQCNSSDRLVTTSSSSSTSWSSSLFSLLLYLGLCNSFDRLITIVIIIVIVVSFIISILPWFFVLPLLFVCEQFGEREKVEENISVHLMVLTSWVFVLNSLTIDKILYCPYYSLFLLLWQFHFCTAVVSGNSAGTCDGASCCSFDSLYLYL